MIYPSNIINCLSVMFYGCVAVVVSNSQCATVNAGAGVERLWDSLSDPNGRISQYNRPAAPSGWQQSGSIAPFLHTSNSPSSQGDATDGNEQNSNKENDNTEYRQYHDILIPYIKYRHTPQYDYANAIAKSMLFYEAQRSGELPYNHRVPWRGDSALDDGYDVEWDLSGGYYDGGGYIKYGFPMAYTATILSWGIIRYRRTYEAIGQLDHALRTIRWATDYFLKCQRSSTEFYGQVGDQQSDSSYIGIPELMNYKRKSYVLTDTNPGSELVGETAAAMAAASIVFYESDREYSDILLKNAKELYDFAGGYKGKYHDSIKPASSAYRSHSGFKDELAWSAAWIYRRTGDNVFLREAKRIYKSAKLNTQATSFSWDDKKVGVQLLMSEITKNKVYKKPVEQFCNYSLPSGKSSYTKQGLLFIAEWGPLRYAANAALICSLAADLKINQEDYRRFAISQMNYILGSTGRSYVIGFGKNPPTKYYHKSSYCPDPPTPCPSFSSNFNNAHILYGALIGGPNKADKFYNRIEKREQSSVAIDYNAGYQSALAAVLDVFIFGENDRPNLDKPGRIGTHKGREFHHHDDEKRQGSSDANEINYDYAKALEYSILFYEAQRSGALTVDSRIPWRSHSGMHDGKYLGIDLRGGYYDNGGYLKFTFPLAFTMTMLSWGLIEFSEAYNSTGTLNAAMDGLVWGADYLIKAHLSHEEVVSQVGDICYDSIFWDRPEYLNETMIRPVTIINPNKPGSEVAAEMAAAFAAMSIALKGISSMEYRKDMHVRAKSLFQFANTYRGVYTEHQTSAIPVYNSTGFEDELAWAAMWIYKATGETTYLNHAKSLYNSEKLLRTPETFSYDDKTAGIHLLFAEKYFDDTEITKFCKWVITRAKKTPLGLLYNGLPPTKHAGNVAFILLLASKKFNQHQDSEKWRFFARDQINYILGSSGRSYMVGYGKKYPNQPFHKASSCPRRPLPCGVKYRDNNYDNLQILYGAVVAGPSYEDDFQDIRTKQKFTSVSLDTNAGVQSSLAALYLLQQNDLLSSSTKSVNFLTWLLFYYRVSTIIACEILLKCLYSEM